MKILGVTGSMGMGKSTVCSVLRRYGFPVFDADFTVHQLQKPKGKALLPIAHLFPDAVKNDILDRQYLRKIITEDPSNLTKIEDVVLPLVVEERQKFLRKSQARGVRWCVLDIPLLFEKKNNLICSKTLVVSAPTSIQKLRIMKRGKTSWEQAQTLIAKQIPNNQKCELADIVIKTGLSKAYTFFQAKRLALLMNMDLL